MAVSRLVSVAARLDVVISTRVRLCIMSKSIH